jgi:drug/metabolite transporter (DMT)-like permease
MTAAPRAMLLMLLFGAAWVAVEIAASSMHRAYSPYEVVWGRYGVHLAFMLALFGRRDPLVLVRTRRPVFQLARSLLMLIMPAAFIMALQRGLDTRILTAAIAVSPMLVCLFGALFLRERPTGWNWIAASLAAVVYVACAWPLPAVSIGQLVLPVVTACSFSLYVVMTRSLRTDTAQANLFYTALGVFVVLSAFMVKVWIMPDAHDLERLVVIGLLGYLTLYALDRSVAAAPVSVSAPLVACHIPIVLALTAMTGGGHP